VATGRRWYLVAHDRDRGEWRTYRIDRIVDVRAATHLGLIAFHLLDLDRPFVVREPPELRAELARMAARAAPAALAPVALAGDD
jgi:predicted DNA-binding transcriptional regulator YafY